MGTCIEAAATARPRRLRTHRGARQLSERAAETCLHRAQHDAGEIDLLINAGIYKDHNTAEPALASIIQEDIGANVGSPPRLGHHGTFSFDVLNGGCGVITAAELVDTFVGGGEARLGMIVAADRDPSPGTSRGFAFPPAGGALLISHVAGERGFQRFATRTFPEHAGLFEAHLRWDPHAGFLRRGRNVVEIYEAPAFAACCVDRSVEVAREVLAGAGLQASGIDLMIASQFPSSFPTEVARALGIAEDHVPRVPAAFAGAHTAGPIAALEAAITAGKLATAQRVLFVTCGAGLTVGVALYTA